MKRSISKLAQKTGAAVLSMALGVAILPMLSGNNDVRAEEAWKKDQTNTGFGTKLIKNPVIPESAGDMWRGDYVYFGTYEGEPILFRVLDKASDDFGGNTLFLDSNCVLYYEQFDTSAYNEDMIGLYNEYQEWYLSQWSDEPMEEGSTDFSDIEWPDVKWKDSSLRANLNGANFLNKDGVFTDAEKNSIFKSVTTGGEPVELESAIAQEVLESSTVALEGDKIFVLEIADVINPEYGYYPYSGMRPMVVEPGYWAPKVTRLRADDGGDDYDYGDDFFDDGYGLYTDSEVYNRIKSITDGEDEIWWLRNTIPPRGSFLGDFGDYMDPAKAVTSSNIGSLAPYMVFEKNGVAPALNVDIGSILFSSIISEESDDMGAFHKLTLIDSGLGVAVAEGSKIVMTGSTIEVPYSVTGDNADQVSVLITDKAYDIKDTADTNILYYGSLQGTFAKDGKGTFELPSDLDMSKWGKEFFVYILAEDINDMTETDYASTPVEIKADDVTVSNGDDNENKTTEYNVKVTSDENGTATASVTKGKEGTEVTLTSTAKDGYKFKEWQVVSGGVTIKDNKFTIGTSDVEIKAVFEAKTSDNNSNGDANNTPTPVPVVTTAPKIYYTIIKAPEGAVKQTEDATFKIQRSFDDEHCLQYFKGVKIGDKELKKDTDFTVKEGCIEVTIKSTCIKDLGEGKHKIIVEFVDGSVAAMLEVKAPETVASKVTTVLKTGEGRGLMIYGVVTLLASAGFAAAGINKRKKVK